MNLPPKDADRKTKDFLWITDVLEDMINFSTSNELTQISLLLQNCHNKITFTLLSELAKDNRSEHEVTIQSQ